MSKTRKICYAAIGAALYFVASCSLKIPLFGHIAVDCGYIVLMVFCALAPNIGIMPAVVCGALGCALESFGLFHWLVRYEHHRGGWCGMGV